MTPGADPVFIARVIARLKRERAKALREAEQRHRRHYTCHDRRSA